MQTTKKEENQNQRRWHESTDGNKIGTCFIFFWLGLTWLGLFGSQRCQCELCQLMLKVWIENELSGLIHPPPLFHKDWIKNFIPAPRTPQCYFCYLWLFKAVSPPPRGHWARLRCTEQGGEEVFWHWKVGSENWRRELCQREVWGGNETVLE